jgi:hypothetical protein
VKESSSLESKVSLRSFFSAGSRSPVLGVGEQPLVDLFSDCSRFHDEGKDGD